MSLNVFKQIYSPWKYPSNWIRNIKLFFRRYKWAYQRATRGYCDYDIWELYPFYSNLFSATLNQLANTAQGWPGDETFPNYKDWIEYLKRMSQLFYRSNEANEYYPTPEGDKWWAWLQEHKTADLINDNSNPYTTAMLQEERENDEKRKQDLYQAIEMLKKTWFDLWD